MLKRYATAIALQETSKNALILSAENEQGVMNLVDKNISIDLLIVEEVDSPDLFDKLNQATCVFPVIFSTYNDTNSGEIYQGYIRKIGVCDLQTLQGYIKEILHGYEYESTSVSSTQDTKGIA